MVSVTKVKHWSGKKFEGCKNSYEKCNTPV